MKPGIYYDMPFAEYQKVEAFSQSHANLIEQCPALLKAMMGYTYRKETPALKFGRAAHEAVFDRKNFALEVNFRITPKFGRTKAEMEAKENFVLENTGKTLISQDEYNEAISIAQSVLGTTTGGSIISDSSSEVSIFWRCPETDVLCKGRMDAWCKGQGVILDLKTTSESLVDESIQRLIANRRYYRQLAWYSYGLDLCGEVTDTHLLVFVQKTRPYPVKFKALSFSSVEQGKREMKELTKRYAECLKADCWPGYPDAISVIDLPPYAQKYATGEDFESYSDHAEDVKEEEATNEQ